MKEARHKTRGHFAICLDGIAIDSRRKEGYVPSGKRFRDVTVDSA